MTEIINGVTYTEVPESRIFYDPSLPQETITPQQYKERLEASMPVREAIKEVNKDKICSAFSIGFTVHEVAKKFNVSISDVNRILKAGGHK